MRPDTFERLGRRLDEVLQTARGPVALIGWSLGGLYARELAKRRPDEVSLVITLGTFWQAISVEALPTTWLDPWGFGSRGRSRGVRNWINSATNGITSSPSLFVPRHLGNGRGEARSLYDNSVAASTLGPCRLRSSE
ncbi:MAG TPA: alpha/beta fold hydrolase [Allosphingosinicella sp.]